MLIFILEEVNARKTLLYTLTNATISPEKMKTKRDVVLARTMQ